MCSRVIFWEQLPKGAAQQLALAGCAVLAIALFGKASFQFYPSDKAERPIVPALRASAVSPSPVAICLIRDGQ